MFQNPKNQANRENTANGSKPESNGWKPWATVNFNLCDSEGAAELIKEGKRLFGAENVKVETVTEKRWKILVRTEDPNYMDREHPNEEGFTRWGIFHRDREFAREMGDPRLGEVTARTKSEAEEEAAKRGITALTSIWAHPLPKEDLS